MNPFLPALPKAIAYAKKLGMKVTMEKNSQKVLKTFINHPKAVTGADAFYPTGYEGDQMIMARQLREQGANFPATYMVYAAQPQFLEIGRTLIMSWVKHFYMKK